MHNRFHPTAALAVLFLGILAWPSQVLAEDAPPNIVFIFADDLGFADLGCYGHPYAETPALDKLASEGTRYTQAYVTGVTCCPSRTGFMTGLFPARFQKYPAGHGFGDRVTITDLLKQRGYRTGHFGKWHIGPEESDGTYGIDEISSGSKSKDSARGRDAGLFDAAIQFIEANAGGPFYVNVWGHATHYPVNTHPELVAKFKDVSVDRADFSETMQVKFDECEGIGGNLDTCMQQYLGDVWSIDLNVQRLLQKIDDLGLRENTIVVFSSDHGPAPVLLGNKKESKEFSQNMLGYAGEFRGGKHNQLEGGVRVPFIVRWPGVVKEGHVDDQSVISGIDWMPTLANIAGVKELPEQVDGEDVSDVWRGTERARVKPLFWKTSSAGSSPSMLDGSWKLHVPTKRGTEIELYDISTDLAERRNVADQHPEVVADLKAKVDAWVAELPESYDKIEGRKENKKQKKSSKG